VKKKKKWGKKLSKHVTTLEKKEKKKKLKWGLNINKRANGQRQKKSSAWKLNEKPKLRVKSNVYLIKAKKKREKKGEKPKDRRKTWVSK